MACATVNFVAVDLRGLSPAGLVRRRVEKPHAAPLEQGRQREARQNAAHMREPGDMAVLAGQRGDELKHDPCADEHPGLRADRKYAQDEAEIVE